MPFVKSKYPSNWQEFSRYIRFERAKNRCEQCGIENYSINERGSKVVLTVAHLDNAGGVCKCEIETGMKCANADHVLALCQKHHLRLDEERHRFNARRTRAQKRGQMWLGDWEQR